ncbi:MarR family winged helix-turn-helix transcriptional regulator [Thalassotalea hakodatensis]|uniref:MarR family winged helix-turn-helix transcriptional regulator n=1 Tax=Thalassotalea hakodatensis TaxID=3030492 RepID=UPI0025740542|nr:MarR family transcriptional regulator [Thalassotalea hakodatensis]
MSKDNEGEQSLDPVMAFFRNIAVIEQLSRARMERALPDGMQASHFGVLSHMCRMDRRKSPAELANIFQVARPSMTNTLQKLAAKGYILIEEDPNDGRGKLVQITSKGRQVFSQAIQTIAPLYKDTIDTLGIDLFKELLLGLDKVRSYMDNNRS